MSKLGKKMQSLIANAFVADAQLKAGLAALGKKMLSSKGFGEGAAQCVAECAKRQYREDIVWYHGQRGIAFGIVKEIDENGKAKYERTKACDATRKWFQRNVIAKKPGAARTPKLKGVWLKIADGIAELRSATVKLHKLDAAQGKEIAAQVTALLNKIQARVEEAEAAE